MKFTNFAVEVLQIPLTPAQRVLVAVAFDGVDPTNLDDADRTIAAELFGAVDIVPPSARSVLVAVIGARAGKTYLLIAAYSLWRALFANLSTLAPGEIAVALIVAPDLRLARQALRYASGAVQAHRDLAQMVVSESSESLQIRRPDGRTVAIEVLPATRGGSALRGRSLVSAALDEAAFFRDENSIVNDGDLFKAVAPRVLPGGLVILASTPWVEEGLLHSQFDKNWGNPRTALAAHGPTLLMLPTERNREAVAREMETDPDNAAREFGAEFILGGSATFFDTETLKNCVSDEYDATISNAGTSVGGDIGLVHDSSSFVAVRNLGEVVVVLDTAELRPSKGQPLKLSFVVEHASEFAKRHNSKFIFVDHHVLQPAREHLPKGITLNAVPGGQAAKNERFVMVRQAMKEGRLVIPSEFRRLRAQLADVYSKPLPGGGVQIFQRRKAGAHGDVASAFILAAWYALRPRAAFVHKPLPPKPEGLFNNESARKLRGF